MAEDTIVFVDHQSNKKERDEQVENNNQDQDPLFVFLKDFRSSSTCPILFHQDTLYNILSKIIHSVNGIQYLNHLVLSSTMVHLNPLKTMKFVSYFHSSLQHLDLSGNKLSTIEGIEECIHLKTLNLAQNYIRKIKGMENLSCLMKLDLGGNYITRIPQDMAMWLVALEELDLSGNNISIINDLVQLKRLGNLHICHFTGNPCAKVPSYRYFVVFHLVSVEILDRVLISMKERKLGRQRYGVSMEEDVLEERSVDDLKLQSQVMESRKLITENLKLRRELEVKDQLLNNKSSEWTKATGQLLSLQQDIAMMKLDSPNHNNNNSKEMTIQHLMDTVRRTMIKLNPEIETFNQYQVIQDSRRDDCRIKNRMINLLHPDEMEDTRQMLRMEIEHMSNNSTCSEKLTQRGETTVRIREISNVLNDLPKQRQVIDYSVNAEEMEQTFKGVLNYPIQQFEGENLQNFNSRLSTRYERLLEQLEFEQYKNGQTFPSSSSNSNSNSSSFISSVQPTLKVTNHYEKEIMADEHKNGANTLEEKAVDVISSSLPLKDCSTSSNNTTNANTIMPVDVEEKAVDVITSIPLKDCSTRGNNTDTIEEEQANCKNERNHTDSSPIQTNATGSRYQSQYQLGTIDKILFNASLEESTINTASHSRVNSADKREFESHLLLAFKKLDFYRNSEVVDLDTGIQIDAFGTLNGRLNVSIVSARNIPITQQVSDPGRCFIALHVNEKAKSVYQPGTTVPILYEYRSSSKENSRYPQWNEDVPVDMGPIGCIVEAEGDREAVLVVSLMQHNKRSHHVEIGRTEIALSSLVDQKLHDDWHTLRNTSCASIRLRCRLKFSRTEKLQRKIDTMVCRYIEKFGELPNCVELVGETCTKRINVEESVVAIEPFAADDSDNGDRVEAVQDAEIQVSPPLPFATSSPTHPPVIQNIWHTLCKDSQIIGGVTTSSNATCKTDTLEKIVKGIEFQSVNKIVNKQNSTGANTNSDSQEPLVVRKQNAPALSISRSIQSRPNAKNLKFQKNRRSIVSMPLSPVNHIFRNENSFTNSPSARKCHPHGCYFDQDSPHHPMHISNTITTPSKKQKKQRVTRPRKPLSPGVQLGKKKMTSLAKQYHDQYQRNCSFLQLEVEPPQGIINMNIFKSNLRKKVKQHHTSLEEVFSSSTNRRLGIGNEQSELFKQIYRRMD